ncbi:uncharacterized protein LOC123531892 [Mercenaria mercenaria]|uniref:uncharacterized protein LOC123531892 n=1 Tax=Mercenaria mercenaria TaxID=6596 RepID=UPI00234EB936|nr:uncharacterized protein LOC123531892 [Mercenaria mercenaria]
MSTFKDFLVWYNNLDVGPFVTAVERLQKFYFDKNIDVLKTAMSVPGIARQLLFKSATEKGAEFSLIDRKNADLHATIKDNIVGGPSIIFTRHHQSGKTKIRGGKTCEKVVGYDANALYLWAIGQAMPEGAFVRRRVENAFKPEHRDQYMQAFNWLNYLNQYEGPISSTKGITARDPLRKIPLDGYDSETKTIYEFRGVITTDTNASSPKSSPTKGGIKSKTPDGEDGKKGGSTAPYGFNVVEMWECEFRDYCKTHPKIYWIRDQVALYFVKNTAAK